MQCAWYNLDLKGFTGAPLWLWASLCTGTHGHISSLGLCCGFRPVSLFFFPMETWEQGKKAGLTSVSPAMGVGRQPGQASGLGTWKQFQVLYFRHHNRSVMYFYPQVHFQHHVYTNSAGTHPRSSIHLYKKTARGRPAEEQTVPVTARCRVSSKILIRLIALILPGWTQAPLPDTSRRTCLLSSGLGGPSAPHRPSWPCPLQGFGELWKGRSSGEGWRRRGEWIAEGQKRRERNGDLSRCPDAHHNPKGIYPVLPVSTSHGRRTCAVSLAGWLWISAAPPGGKNQN